MAKPSVTQASVVLRELASGSTLSLPLIGGHVTQVYTAGDVSLRVSASSFAVAPGSAQAIVQAGRLVVTFQADLTADQFVNGDDLLHWATLFGSHDALATGGDVNGDGTVNGEDFVQWQQEFGRTPISAPIKRLAVIPEPLGVALALCSALVALRRQRAMNL